MKLKRFILSLICLLAPLGVSHASNGNFLATLLDGQGNAITNTKAILIFSGAPQSQNNGTVVQWRTATYTDGNGQILFTNAAPGKWTIATVSGNTVAFSFNMPVTNGTIAVQYNTTADAGATVPGGSVAYDVNASDLRYDPAGAAAAAAAVAITNNDTRQINWSGGFSWFPASSWLTVNDGLGDYISMQATTNGGNLTASGAISAHNGSIHSTTGGDFRNESGNDYAQLFYDFTGASAPPFTNIETATASTSAMSNVVNGITVTSGGSVTYTTNSSGLRAASLVVSPQTNLQISAIGGAGDSYSAYFGGTTNQWIDQTATVLTNTTGGIFYSNAALPGSWVAVELTNQVNALLSSMATIAGPKLILATGGINDLSNGGLHAYGQQNSNQVFLAITNIIAAVHAKGAKILWGIQPIFGGNPISATTYGTNWFGLCQLLRQLTNGTPNYPSNCVPDYLVDFAAHQDEYTWMPDGHPGILAEQCLASQALQALARQPAYSAPYASAVHFTVPYLRATNYTVLDSGSGNWATVIGFGGLLWPVSGHARSQIAPGNQWEWANGSGFMMTLDSTLGNVSIAGTYNGNGSGLTNLNAATLTGTLPQSTLPAGVLTNNLASFTVVTNGLCWILNPSTNYQLWVGTNNFNVGTPIMAISNNYVSFGQIPNSAATSAYGGINAQALALSATMYDSQGFASSGAASGGLLTGDGKGGWLIRNGANVSSLTNNLALGGVLNASNGVATFTSKIPGAVTVGSSAFNFTNNGVSALQCCFADAAVYSVALNGVSVFPSVTGGCSLVLQSTNVCTITYLSTTPTFYTNNW